MLNPIAHPPAETLARPARPTFQVHLVGSGEALLNYLYRRGEYARLRGQPLPGLILIDLNVPRAERHTAVAVIKADPFLSKIPLLMLTRSRGKAESNRIYTLAGNTYLTRPLPVSALLNLLERIGSAPVIMLSASAPTVGGHRVYGRGKAPFVGKPVRAVPRLELLRSLGKYWSFEMVQVAPTALAA